MSYSRLSKANHNKVYTHPGPQNPPRLHGKKHEVVVQGKGGVVLDFKLLGCSVAALVVKGVKEFGGY